MEPQFPLKNAPACQWCKKPCTREIVSAANVNGNFGRPYYTCVNSQHARKFSTWDDYQGITPGNPRCWCGFTSRRTMTTGPAPTDFYSCPERRCKYTQDAPVAPNANNYRTLHLSSRHAGSAGPQFEVDMEAQAIEMKPAYRERGFHCCVVM